MREHKPHINSHGQVNIFLYAFMHCINANKEAYGCPDSSHFFSKRKLSQQSTSTFAEHALSKGQSQLQGGCIDPGGGGASAARGCNPLPAPQWGADPLGS
jgi:hypothetical protein